MKKVVVYKSGTGFTKQYANWIASELGCEAIEFKKVSKSTINEVEFVIYGGWIMGSMIMGLDKMKKMNPKKLIVFGVGASGDSEQIRSMIMKQNQLEGLPFFYLEGGFHFDQLNIFTKSMLKLVKKSIVKKELKTEQDLYMEKVLGTNFNHSNKSQIEPLIRYTKSNF